MPVLEDIRSAHSEPIHAVLARKYARFCAKPAPPTVAVLEAFGYPVFPAVLAFDALYDGLEMSGEPTYFDGRPIDADWSFDTAMGWTLGAASCVHGRVHGSPRGDQDFLDLYGDTLGLVPVAYGPSDDIWYLDRVGRGYLHDTCSAIGGPHLVALGVEQLFARMVLESWCLKRLAVRAPGFVGQAVAAALGLDPIAEASDGMGRWWGRGACVVGERFTLPGEGYPVRPHTWAGVADREGLRRVKEAIAGA